MFVLHLVPVVCSEVESLNRRTQDSVDTPWSRHAAFRRHVAVCLAHAAPLSKPRCRLRIMSLLSVYLANDQKA